jgi:DNA polymerase III alpha subunit
MTHYVELQVLTHFSLLRGASSPDELFAAAAVLGYPAIGVSAGHNRPHASTARTTHDCCRTW